MAARTSIPRNKPSMPPQQRLRRRDRGDIPEGCPAHSVGTHSALRLSRMHASTSKRVLHRRLTPTRAQVHAGQPAAIVVRQAQPPPLKPFVIRIKNPNGTKAPPHWHPTDENITVPSGTFIVGMGSTFDSKGAKP